jgi:hypothetical protein
MATAEIAPIISGEKLAPGVQTLVSEAEIKKGPHLIAPAAMPLKSEEIPVQFTQAPKVTVTLVAEIPSARPKSVLFAALVHPKLRLRKPIPLEVSVQEGHVVLNWNEAEEFACGATTGEALDDFSKTVSGLYFDLNDPKVRLGENLEKVRRILNEYIEPRQR